MAKTARKRTSGTRNRSIKNGDFTSGAEVRNGSGSLTGAGYPLSRNRTFHSVTIPEGVVVVETPADDHSSIDLRGDATLRLVGELSAALPEQRLEELEVEFGSMSSVVAHLLDGLPTKNILDDVVGPFRDTTNLVKYLGVAGRQTLEERVNAGTLLCVRSGDNRRMYPTFQFDEHRNGLPRLAEVLTAFHADRKNAWDAALWLAQPSRDLDGFTPAQALRGKDSDFAIELAHRAGAVLAA